MSYQDSEIVASILEAAIDGITKPYLAGKYDAATEEHVEMLVKEQLLAELADRSRNHVAYRTTQKGISYLLARRSLHSASIAMVEA